MQMVIGLKLRQLHTHVRVAKLYSLIIMIVKINCVITLLLISCILMFTALGNLMCISCSLNRQVFYKMIKHENRNLRDFSILVHFVMTQQAAVYASRETHFGRIKASARAILSYFFIYNRHCPEIKSNSTVQATLKSLQLRLGNDAVVTLN